MNIRSALIIISMFVVLCYTITTTAFGHTRIPSSQISAPMRTQLLPALPALYDPPTTTTTSATTTTTTTAPPPCNAFACIPVQWQPTSICEEDRQDDPNYGYFGIQEWMGFDGYATAGEAPLSVQLDWEYTYQHYPPDAPGECHGY